MFPQTSHTKKDSCKTLPLTSHRDNSNTKGVVWWPQNSHNISWSKSLWSLSSIAHHFAMCKGNLLGCWHKLPTIISEPKRIWRTIAYNTKKCPTIKWYFATNCKHMANTHVVISWKFAINFPQTCQHTNGILWKFATNFPHNCHAQVEFWWNFVTNFPFSLGSFWKFPTNFPQTSHSHWEVFWKFPTNFPQTSHSHWEVFGNFPQTSHKLPILIGKFVGSLWEVCGKFVGNL